MCNFIWTIVLQQPNCSVDASVNLLLYYFWITEELHHGFTPYVLNIIKWHSWRDDCSHWRLVNMLGTVWCENISKTVKWLIVLKEETFCCSLRVNTEQSVVWLHPSVLTCSVNSSSVTVLVFCSCPFRWKEDVATPSCLIYIEDVEHLVWWDSGTPLTHSLAETL
jgi:hypothetical protein